MSDRCPVDHTTRSRWINLGSASSNSASPTPPQPQPSLPSSDCSAPTSNPASGPSPTASASAAGPAAAEVLPTSRETSSIPRTASENWVYPSEAQFFAAMLRKQRSRQEDHAAGASDGSAAYPPPRAADMRVIVPIHNAVNERTWAAVKGWEDGRGGERCGGVRLVSFRGRPGERSPKAWMKVLLGYTAPFDRHDWVVDRCGMRMRYIIDFYTGRADPAAPHNPSFYIDARPALDNWEGVKMRMERFWEHWVDRLWGSSSSVKAPQLDSKEGLK